jgi:hypothetical protein
MTTGKPPLTIASSMSRTRKTDVSANLNLLENFVSSLSPHDSPVRYPVENPSFKDTLARTVPFLRKRWRVDRDIATSKGTAEHHLG